MRSKLFVPATRPELFGKALASAADALSFDLEDAVPEECKHGARQALGSWLDGGLHLDSDKVLIVRVNPVDTPHFERDVAAVVRAGVRLVNLPKPETVDAVRHAADCIARAEREQGMVDGVGLLLNIETPRALREAASLAASHSRVDGLQLGLGDLFESLGIDRGDRAAVHQAMFAVRMAAGEARVYACDGAFATVGDEEGFLAEARMARSLGFIGKTCIHPRQVPLANSIFLPGQEELAQARKTLAAAQQAFAQGLGAIVVDGRMVDRPFIERARRVLEAGRRAGLVS